MTDADRPDDNRPSLADIARAQQADRPAYHEDPATDRALALLLKVAEDLCVQRDRLDTALRMAAEGKPVNEAAIDAFEVDSSLEAERLARHRAFFQELFTALRDR